ncbi:MAG: SH3 domain-containing protein [Bacteroidetes bacterium]|nr:SH3 domain-containing protein [Bacteroidota bacterium]
MRTVTILLSFITCLSSTGLYSQQTELDNLKKEKANLEVQIKKLQQKHDDVVKKIDALEASSSGSTTQGGISGILTKTGNNGGSLREKPTSTGEVLAEVPANTEILVQREVQGLYFKVTYQGKTGYMSYSSIESNPEIDKMLINKNNKNSTVDDEKLARLKKLYGNETANKIVAGLIWEGMSQAMAIESIGRPKNTVKNATEEGIREEWQYGDKTLIFINGELHHWDND